MDMEKEEESSSEIDKIARRSFEEGHKEVMKRNYEDMRTLFQQDYEALQEARKRGIDVTKSFRVMRLEKERDNPHFHVFVTKGEEKNVEEDMNTMNTSRRFIVDNRAVDRFKMGESDIKELASRIKKALDSQNIRIEPEE